MAGNLNGWARAVLAALVPLAGCSGGAFACSDDAECGDGFCGPAGFCAFEDDTCASGARYGEFAGGVAGECLDPGGSTGTTGAPPLTTSGASEDTSTSPDATSSTDPTTADTADETGTTFGPTTAGPGPLCGDGQIDADEDCDDGNAREGDGCTQCRVSGTVIWMAVRDGTAGPDTYQGAAVVNDDVVFVGGTVGTVGGSSDVLVARLTADGETVWTVTHDVESASDRAEGVVLDSDTVVLMGRAAVADEMGAVDDERWIGRFAAADGQLIRQATFGRGQLFDGARSRDGLLVAGASGNSATAERAWTAVLDADLTTVWSTTSAGPAASQYYEVAVTPRGEMFAAGMRGTNTNNAADLIVDLIESAGPSELVNIASEFGLAQAQSIVAGPSGDLFVGGFLQDNTDLDARAASLRRLSRTGTEIWATFESSGKLLEPHEIESIALAPNGDVLATGLYWAGDVLLHDVLLRRFDPSGALLWAAQIDYASARDLGRDIVVNAAGEVYVCGEVNDGVSDRAFAARIVP